MTSCGEVCIDKISSQARKRSASYIIATANASAGLATEVIGFGSGRRSTEASYFAIRFRSISTVFRYQGVTRVSVITSCARKFKRVIEVFSHHVHSVDGVHEAQGDPASKRGVCAGPRVAHTENPGGHGIAVHHEAPVTVDDAAMGSTPVIAAPSSQ
jgi:hypothetical protein